MLRRESAQIHFHLNLLFGVSRYNRQQEREQIPPWEGNL